MDQETKKISFGFSKSSKKNQIFAKPLEKGKKIELIDCLESQTIKIKNAIKVDKRPLIIPMVQSTNILDRRREQKKEKHLENEQDKPDSELTVDELAARELIKEAQNGTIQSTSKPLVLSAVTENVLVIEGKEEPTLEDYDSVPIGDYGLAMLRGMGWIEGSGIGKNNKNIKMVEPALRPKGMGLGATNAYKEHKSKPPLDKNGKELTLNKGSFAKITDGKKKGCYCEVQGFDDEAGRVIVKTSLDGLILSLNEFLVAPVTKEEYDKSSKVINIVKYEEYKDKVTGIDKSSKNDDESSSSLHNSKQKYHNYKSRSRHEYKKKSKKYRSSSNSSVESGDDTKIKRERTRSSSSSDHGRKKNKNKSKTHKYKLHKSKSESDSDHKYNYKRETHSSKHEHNRKRR